MRTSVEMYYRMSVVISRSSCAISGYCQMILNRECTVDLSMTRTDNMSEMFFSICQVCFSALKRCWKRCYYTQMTRGRDTTIKGGLMISLAFFHRGQGAPLKQFALPSETFASPQRLLPPPEIWSKNNRKISITIEIRITINSAPPPEESQQFP